MRKPRRTIRPRPDRKWGIGVAEFLREPKAPIGWHVILHLANDATIARTDAARRIAARKILEIGRSRGLVAFRVRDADIHVALVCSRWDAGVFACCAAGSIRKRLNPPTWFETARIRPIGDRADLHSVVHILRDQGYEDACRDPVHDGSNLPDLLGCRLLGAYTSPRLRALLPRLEWDFLVRLLGAHKLYNVAPYFERLAEAAAAACCLPNLTGHHADCVAARRAAVHAGLGLHSIKTLAALLGVAPRTVARLRKEPRDETLIETVYVQLLLRSR